MKSHRRWLKSRLGTALTAAVSGAVVLTSAVAMAPAARADASLAGGDYVALAGARTLFATNVAANATADVTVLGVAGIPTFNVSAVLVDIEVVNPSANTFVDVFPKAGARLSTLNAPAKTPQQSNSAVVPLGADGKISVYNYAGTTRINVDVQGYYTSTDNSATGGGFVPLARQTPVFDTRNGVNTAKATIPAKGTRVVNLAGGTGTPVPAGATSVYLTMFAFATAAGSITASPSTGTKTTASVFSHPTGAWSSGFTVKPDASGNVTFTNNGTAAIDLVSSAYGYTTPVHGDGSGYRTARQRFATVTIPANGIVDVTVGGRSGVPVTGLTAAALNFTVVSSTQGGYLRVWPKGTAEPGSGTSYFPGNRATASFATPVLGTDGKVSVRNTSTAAISLSVDLQGFYTSTRPAAAPPTFSPTAVVETAPTSSTNKGLQFAYVDNSGRLLVGIAPNQNDLSTVQYTTVSTLADTFAGTPDVTINGNNSQVTAQYSDTGVRGKSSTVGSAPSSTTAFSNFGGSFAGSPDVAVMPNGSYQQFAIDTDGKLWTLQQGSAEPWWHNLGSNNLTGTPTVTPVNNGVRITAITKNGGVTSATYVNGVLSAWTDLGSAGITTRPAVATRPGFLAQIVVTQGNGQLATRAQRADGSWGEPLDVGGPDDTFRSNDAPAIIFDNVTGQLEILARSADDGFLYSSGETTQGSQTFRPWRQASGDIAASAPTMTPVTGSSNGYGWIGVFRTPQNATRVITPTYDAVARGSAKRFAGTSTTKVAAPKS